MANQSGHTVIFGSKRRNTRCLGNVGRAFHSELLVTLIVSLVGFFADKDKALSKHSTSMMLKVREGHLQL